AAARLLLRGQTNYVRGLFQMNNAYRTDLLLADHARPIDYQIPLPPPAQAVTPAVRAHDFYIHAPKGRASRAIEDATERFVDETCMGATPSVLQTNSANDGRDLRMHPV